MSTSIKSIKNQIKARYQSLLTEKRDEIIAGICLVVGFALGVALG